MDKDFVFLDHRGSRWPRIRFLALFLSAVAIVAGIIFVQELLIRPKLILPPAIRDLKTKLRAVEAVRVMPSAKRDAQPWLRFVPREGYRLSARRSAKPVAMPSPDTDVRAAMYVGWDAASLQSLKQHKDLVTHVVPEWFSLTSMDLLPKEVSDNDLLSFLAGKHITLMPRLTNLGGNEWTSDPVEALIRTTPDRQDAFINALMSSLTRIKAGGIVVDWQGIDPMYSPQLTTFLHRLANRLHGVGMHLWISISVGDDLRAFDLTALDAFTDKFIAELQDENSDQDTNPGPIASQPWFEGWLHIILGYSRPEKWIISLGAYGYDWTQGKPRAATLSFADCMARAEGAGLGACTSGKPDYNPYFSYQTDGETHSVWFLDASTFLNQLQEVEEEGCGGVLINRLGSEDPSIWGLLEVPQDALTNAKTLDKMQLLDPGNTMTNVGSGDFLEVDMTTSPGQRSFSVDADGRVCVTYTKYPRYVTIYHEGGGKPNQVALTFDDGPSPYTPQILDILAAYHVHATFFLIGKQCEKYPKLVRRILAEGHNIGSHTYTHPNLGEISAEQAILELNATQRLIEWLTGRSTILFRPPYNADSLPQNLADVRPLELAGSLGYLNICESVDLEDWERPPAKVLLERLRERRSIGNIVLLHDGGGDRSQTVEALPQIIEYLQGRGDEIVSLQTLLGVSRGVLVPPIMHSESTVPRLVANLGLLSFKWLEEFIWAFMVIATVLILLRTLIVAVLAFLHKQQQTYQYAHFPNPNISAVSVVLAAYNEGKVIQQTLASVLHTNFQGSVEVIVVDDGSQDDTAQKVAELVGKDSRLRLIRQENRGKARALIRALADCKHEVVISLDADTQFEPHTIPALLIPFSQANVGAVSGHARVGNLRTWIARFQSLEYVCGFNLDRRAYDSLNAITVVPGAVSAFRKQAIAEAGGVSWHTLAEDTDLTLSLHRAGWHVAYAPDAIAWTEAPETIAALARQRFRWAFGTMQCLWKHRDMFFNPRFGTLGWFVIPNIWFFQIILVAAVPVVDTLLLISLFAGNGGALAIYFIAFLVTDLILAWLACLLEGEPFRRALYVFPMRFLYRPLLSYTVWRSIIHSLKGAWVGWGKLERKGSVNTSRVGVHKP